ncbi:MAG: glycosyltransferase [Cyanomargarita calcarea GSE-NOS-MK-12-04C]|jgi:glycosyltransferase involved in cell wall biosynthesis|uniref:Glycosyltransferase n=1 Tax=Cyanomargarita calcarea GSE-NOS-MK-12-04C TaxID=2839659 RepID=A0A951QP43_9CYAN|nr:glycosyltransferase [Cyanomargarita calcarea GSE-NOS-MK-12-04C]
MISIIIPTLNRAESLNRTLKSLVAQNFPINNYETLVIDNGSKDETESVYEKNKYEHPNHQIRYIYEPEPGLLSGRHRGALEAKGEILVFIDDDIEADVNWLQAIKESFDDSTVQIVGGRNLPDFEVEPPKWLEWFWIEHPYGKLCSELSLLDFGDQVRDIDANYVWGLNFSIRKVALFELGGFHPDCIPKHLQCFQGDGETGLTQKAKLQGYRAIYQPNALVFHSVSQERMTYEYFDRRYFYQGVSDSYSFFRQSQGQLKEVSLIDKIKNILKMFKQIGKKIIISQKEKKALKERFFNAYKRGYQFHKNAIINNPELLDWVLKTDYWDYKLPQINITHD